MVRWCRCLFVIKYLPLPHQCLRPRPWTLKATMPHRTSIHPYWPFGLLLSFLLGNLNLIKVKLCPHVLPFVNWTVFLALLVTFWTCNAWLNEVSRPCVHHTTTIPCIQLSPVHVLPSLEEPFSIFILILCFFIWSVLLFSISICLVSLACPVVCPWSLVIYCWFWQVHFGQIWVDLPFSYKGARSLQ